MFEFACLHSLIPNGKESKIAHNELIWPQSFTPLYDSTIILDPRFALMQQQNAHIHNLKFLYMPHTCTVIYIFFTIY